MMRENLQHAITIAHVTLFFVPTKNKVVYKKTKEKGFHLYSHCHLSYFLLVIFVA